MAGPVETLGVHGHPLPYVHVYYVGYELMFEKELLLSNAEAVIKNSFSLSLYKS
jgi:hypothetical protein